VAEEEAAATGGKNFLMHKIGPLPVIAYVGAAGAVLWYVRRKQGASSSTSAAGAVQTDPAGNTGTIDPATGYVYGSTQDAAGLAADSSGGSTGTTSGSGGSTVSGQYSTNQAWSEAAINFLVGVGVDPTEANSAITAFIGSQTLTTAQQGEVNLAIQSIGAPPSPPAPGTAPSPIVTPPTPGTVTASNPPTGFAVTNRTSTAISVNWNSVANAKSYTVGYAAGSGQPQSVTVPSTSTSTTVSNLKPGTGYNMTVQATPAKEGDPYASLFTSTAAAPAAGAAPAPASKPTPAPAPAPAKDPNLHYVSDGTLSLNDLVRDNPLTPRGAQGILDATAITEPAAVAKYEAGHNNNAILPKGTKWAIPGEGT
jgi:hypothetical protein